MYTLCIRYALDPNRIAPFRAYVDAELAVIRRSGGRIVGYFLPTDFAGPAHEAYGLIDFATLAAYEDYRGRLARDEDHQRNAAELAASGAIVAVRRSIIERVGDPS